MRPRAGGFATGTVGSLEARAGARRGEGGRPAVLLLFCCIYWDSHSHVLLLSFVPQMLGGGEAPK